MKFKLDNPKYTHVYYSKVVTSGVYVDITGLTLQDIAKGKHLKKRTAGIPIGKQYRKPKRCK